MNFQPGDRIRVVNPKNRLHGLCGTVISMDTPPPHILTGLAHDDDDLSLTIELELASGEVWLTTYRGSQLAEIDLITRLGELVKNVPVRWYVYVLVSEHPKFAGRTYVGASVNPDRRLRQHNGVIKGGAKATRGFRPWRLARKIGPFEQKGALKEERRVKKLRKRRLTG